MQKQVSNYVNYYLDSLLNDMHFITYFVRKVQLLSCKVKSYLD